MDRTRIKLGVYVDLDPVPGTFHSADSSRNQVSRILNESIPHYKPTVSIDSYNTSKSTDEGWMFATSKNTGPSWGSDPVYLEYLGKDINEAEKVVGDFSRYQKDEKDFPKEFPDIYTALPRGMNFEMMRWYMADGWWYAIHRFKL